MFDGFKATDSRIVVLLVSRIIDLAINADGQSAAVHFQTTEKTYDTEYVHPDSIEGLRLTLMHQK